MGTILISTGAIAGFCLWISGTRLGALLAFVAFSCLFIFLGMALPDLHQEHPATLPIELFLALVFALAPRLIKNDSRYRGSLAVRPLQ